MSGQLSCTWACRTDAQRDSAARCARTPSGLCRQRSHHLRAEQTAWPPDWNPATEDSQTLLLRSLACPSSSDPRTESTRAYIGACPPFTTRIECHTHGQARASQTQASFIGVRPESRTWQHLPRSDEQARYERRGCLGKLEWDARCSMASNVEAV